MTVTMPQRNPQRTHLRRAAGAAVLLILTVLVSGCGLSVPSDPNGTLDAVKKTTIRVGASPEPGLVEVDGAEPHGPLVDLTEEFAAHLDAGIEWTIGSEETLVGGLEAGSLDLAIGGFTDETPWIDRAGITRGYGNIGGAHGRSLILLIPLGENAFLSELEGFLDEEVGS